MNRLLRTFSFLSILAFSTLTYAADKQAADSYTVTAAAPASLTVIVTNTATGAEQTLTFDPPQNYVIENLDAKAPNSFASWYKPWEPWPRGRRNEPSVIDLRPSNDEQGTRILGNLFRSVIVDSIVITTADGSKTFVQDKDYVVNADWGQVASLSGHLGEMGVTELKASYTAAKQRIDLIQVSAKGKVSVKQGQSALVCPQIPEPDSGAKALAGIYIAPWLVKDNPHYGDVGNAKVSASSDYAITEHEILIIDPAAPVQPINKSALVKSQKKLDDGKELRIAFLGDSIMLGAEAGQWWDGLWTEKNLAYPSKFVTALRKQYPQATVTGIAAFRGGSKTSYGLKSIEEVVLPAKPDLLLLGFGANDLSGRIGGGPNNPPAKFKQDMKAMVQLAKNNDVEVILVIVQSLNPWLKNGSNDRFPAYRQAILEVADEEHVACADVNTQWANLATRGIPPYTQLHNWNNHPGIAGHALFAEFMMRFFD